MSCYRKGGCGPYEMYSCSECPASKPEYAARYSRVSVPEKATAYRIEHKDDVVTGRGFTGLTAIFTNEGECCVECVELTGWSLNMVTGVLVLNHSSGSVSTTRTKVMHPDVALSVLLDVVESGSSSVPLHVHFMQSCAELYYGFLKSKVASETGQSKVI